jgi:WD40 repeat protein
MRAQTQWGNLLIHRDTYHQVSISQFGTPISRYGSPNQTIHSRTMLPGNRAAIGLSQSVIVFDALNGRPIYRLPGHLDDVWAVTPSPDQKHLLTGSDDETMQIWNLDRYEHTLSLFIANDDWVAWTPQGYYAASPGGENLMGWHVQRGFDSMATFYPASRFRKRFYRPELIRRVLSAGGPLQALKQLEPDSKEIKLSDIQHSLPPKVTISVMPPANELEPGAKYQVQVSASPSDGDSIRLLKLLIDGRPGPQTHEEESLAPSPVPESVGTGQESRVVWDISLSPGSHRLVAKAESDRSIGLSDPADVSTASPVANSPRLFVLAIGVSGNQRPDLRRAFASPDAQALGVALGNQRVGQFSDIQVRTIIDPLVTRFNFEDGFQWLKQSMTPDDVGIISFAGRVLRDQHDSLYFQHQESRFGDPAAGFSDRTLLDYVRKTPGKLMLILDVLEHDENAASTFPAVGSPTPAYERRSLADLIRQVASEDYGVTVLAQTGSAESAADATTPANSAFARSVIDALSTKGDTNSDGVVDSRELVQFVRTDMKQRSASSFITGAVPSLMKPFPIARPR